jgi:hypothetical protein
MLSALTVPLSAPATHLRFDPVEHRYFLGSQELPGVSRIISELSGSPWYTEEGRDRGRDIHLATRYSDEDDLHLDSCEEISGFVLAWRRFLSESGFVIELIEEPLHSPKFHYAGTPDRVGVLHAARAVIDIKGGAPEPWHGVQLAGYAQMLQERYGLPPLKRCAVYLHESGTYSLREYREPEDWFQFLRSLGTFWWLCRVGGRPLHNARPL